jgi:hypothetical protein
VVVFRGISVYKVVTNFLKMYCDPAALVVVVNASDYEEVCQLVKLIVMLDR